MRKTCFVHCNIISYLEFKLVGTCLKVPKFSFSFSLLCVYYYKVLLINYILYIGKRTLTPFEHLKFDKDTEYSLSKINILCVHVLTVSRTVTEMTKT